MLSSSLPTLLTESQNGYKKILRKFKVHHIIESVRIQAKRLPCKTGQSVIFTYFSFTTLAVTLTVLVFSSSLAEVEFFDFTFLPWLMEAIL